MRSEPATPSEDGSSADIRATTRPHIVPIDTTDPMSQFISEDTLPANHRIKAVPNKGHEDLSSPPAPAKREDFPPPPAPAKREHFSPSPAPAKRENLAPLRVPAKREDFSPPAVLATRSGSRNIPVALLWLVVLAQAGVIAFLMLSDRAAGAPTDTGAVTITSDPGGSPVTIDGTARGTTPLTVTLAAGTYRVDVGAGAQVRSRTLNVTRGGETAMHVGLTTVVSASATAGTGGLHIVTEPPGARVWIDGESRGVAPVTVSNLKVGDHSVVVRGGSGAVGRTVTVQEATVGSLIVSMNGSAALASGWLAITSDVPLQIREKGTVVGTTESPRILLPSGAHELELVNAALDYRVARSVRITTGQTTTVALKSPMGTISVNAIPWAEVWIDGRPAGDTPIGNLSIAIGSHELLFKHPELGEQRRTVTVGAVAPQRVGVDMRKP